MKKFLALLALVFTLTTAQAADVFLVGYWTGAWYETSVGHKVRDREAGQMDIYQWSDGTLDVDIWYNGQVTQTGVGVWERNFRTKKSKVTFTANGYTYKGGGTDNFWSGTLTAGTFYRIKGRFQLE